MVGKNKYVVCEKDESQYEEYDLSEIKIVPAKYVKARVETDRGNPYIEVLDVLSGG